MKKFLLLVLVVFATNNVLAQRVRKVGERVDDDIKETPYIIDLSFRISIGPKVGMNMASMSGLQDELALNLSNGMGFQGGLAANIHFGRRTPKANGGTGLWGVQVEAMYSQRSIKTDIEDFKFSCLEVPVLAQYYILPSLCIEAGPTFVTTLSSSPDEIFIPYFEETSTSITDLTIKTGEIKALDVMLSAGVGYKHRSGFTASARYNLGMSELAGNFAGKVSTVSVSIGWLFKVVK